MSDIDYKFVACHNDGLIKPYNECLACGYLAQIKEVDDRVVIECVYKHRSMFATSMNDEEAERLRR